MCPNLLSRQPGGGGPLHRSLVALRTDRRGAIAPVVAVFMPVALGLAGLAIDVSNSYVEQNRLQTAVDEASLVAVQQLPDIEAARAALVAAFAKQYQAGRRDSDQEEDDEVEPTAIEFGRWNPATREVTATDPEGPPPNAVSFSVERLAANGQGMETWFLAALGVRQLDLRARAVARAEGSAVGTCIFALEQTASEAVHTQGAARLRADDCRIQVNSAHLQAAIQVTGDSPHGGIHAAEICVVGGAANSHRMSPAPVTGCDARPDPLRNFTPPPFGACNHHDFTVHGGNTVIHPGVYCGGLTIGGGAHVSMLPGTYVIKDGAFEAEGGQIRINADGVALHLVGDNAFIDLQGPVVMNHKAPATGPFAGIAIYHKASEPVDITSQMGQGNSVTRIEGTVYLPDQHLRWGGTPGTTLPHWTLLVARTLYVHGTAELRVESRFADSDVPAPEDFKEHKRARLVN